MNWTEENEYYYLNVPHLESASLDHSGTYRMTSANGKQSKEMNSQTPN